MSEDADAGIIQAWLDEHEGWKVCSMMIYREAFGNHLSKPTRIETDRICEIMNTSIVGWEPGPTARFPEYGTQRTWVCVNKGCKREDNPTDQATGYRILTEEETKQLEMPF